MINYSAAQLVKMSASQILYFMMKKQQRQPTQKQLDGNKYADDLAKELKLGEESIEKRGVVKTTSGLIFFTVDLVIDNRFIEVKKVEGESADWYFKSSVVQSTLYASLLSKTKILTTPTFRLKEGYNQSYVKVPSSWSFELWFGSDTYEVFPDDKVLEHYVKKVDIITNALPDFDFDACREFDIQYKHLEYDLLLPKYKQLNNLKLNLT